MAKGGWNLEFEAPQFLDFQDMPKDENAERYFGKISLAQMLLKFRVRQAWGEKYCDRQDEP